MTTVRVGVRDLKAHLSEYLDRAAAGETIVVTERGHAKVQIRALDAEQRIAQGIADGWIAPAAKPGPPPIPAARHPGRITIAEAMSEDRGS